MHKKAEWKLRKRENTKTSDIFSHLTLDFLDVGF